MQDMYPEGPSLAASQILDLLYIMSMVGICKIAEVCKKQNLAKDKKLIKKEIYIYDIYIYIRLRKSGTTPPGLCIVD